MHDFFPNDVGHHHDHCCDDEHKASQCCDDQLPLFSTMGRGIKGDGFKVRIASDNCTETYLEGLSYDEASKTWKSEWITENINGGELSCQYNFRPFTIPQTFTFTLIYRRPNRHPDRTHTGIHSAGQKDNDSCEWSWTSPAIPYIWSIDDDGNRSDPDASVGSGVATIFVRTSKNEKWDPKKHEKLIYPDGTTRDDFNAPLPEKAWTANLTFGFGGDIELPNFDDLAKIIGCSKEDIFNILQDNSVTWNGIEADNLKDYIDKCDKRDLDHIHKDLGFNSSDHKDKGAFGGENTVKEYIDKKIKDLEDDMDDKLKKANIHIQNLYGLLDDLLNHIYGASKTEVDSGSAPSVSVPDNKGWKITWNPDKKIPQGNINVLSDTGNNAILTHDPATNVTGDVKAK